MSLTPPRRRRERILAFGTGGVGKTHAVMQIARAVDATIWIIETDPSIDAVIENFEDEVGVREAWRDGAEDESWGPYLDPNGSIVIYRTTTWPAVRDAMAEVWERADFEDWIIVDNITLPWEWVQAWYWQEVIGEEQDEFLLEIRKAQLADDNADGKPAEGMFNEWSFINPHYAKHMTNRLLNPPCHLFCTAEQTDVVKHFDEKIKDTWGLYGTIGVKPKGQKKAGHLTHTVLHFTKSKAGEFRLRTIKDRGDREEWNREVWEDFADEYLGGTAGWTSSTSSTSSSPRTKTSRATPAASASVAATTPAAKPKGKPKPAT